MRALERYPDVRAAAGLSRRASADCAHVIGKVGVVHGVHAFAPALIKQGTGRNH